MKSVTPIVLAALFLISCGDVVTFTEPLPIGKSDLSDFPRRYRGTYSSEDGSHLVHIDKTTLVQEYDYDIRIHADSLEPGMVLVGDTLFAPDAKEYYLVTVDSNYIIYHVNNKDTSFQISDVNLLRKAKGYLFLNYMHDKDSWQVESMKLQKGELVFGYISSQEEIELLNEITEQPSDTVALAYSPTKRQFRKFVAAKGFGTDEKFVKVK